MSAVAAPSGRVVLVTGGTRGVGRAIAAAFAADGATVVVCGRTPPEGADAGAAELVAADVRQPDDVARLVEAIVARHGRLDVVVNNAGGSPPADAATASPRFTAALVGLNIASLSGMRPSPGTAAYGAAKAGLINVTASLAAEFAPKVRVCAVTPGAVDTPELHAQYGEAYVDAVAATVPLGRMGRPDDVAAACLFLASPQAAFVTGSNLVVDGGGDDPPPA